MSDDLFQSILKSASGKKQKARLGTDDFWTTDMLSTGIPPVDHALGGGFGYGRSAEVYGDFSTGKSVLVQLALAENQRNGGISILIDTEGSFSKEFFDVLGGNSETLILPADMETDSVEGCFNTINRLLNLMVTKEGEIVENSPKICIAWDGIAGTTTKHLQDTGMDTTDMSKPIKISQGCALMAMKLKRARVCVIATNQIRDVNIGKIGYGGAQIDTPGGRSWKFHSSQRVELKYDGGKAASSIVFVDGKGTSANEFIIGKRLRGIVTKNKLASPFGIFYLTFFTESGYPHPVYTGVKTVAGVDIPQALFDYYLHGKFFLDSDKSERVIQANGAWYQLNKQIDPDQKSFHACDWLEKLDKFPILKVLLTNAFTNRDSEVVGPV